MGMSPHCARSSASPIVLVLRSRIHASATALWTGSVGNARTSASSASLSSVEIMTVVPPSDRRREVTKTLGHRHPLVEGDRLEHRNGDDRDQADGEPEAHLMPIHRQPPALGQRASV